MEKEENSKKKEISIDWFEDHESCEVKAEEEFFEDDSEELEETIFEEDEEFSKKIKNFLSNQRKEVSLEKILELPENNFENSLPKKEEESLAPPENNFDYMANPKEDQMKYQPVEPEAPFEEENLSNEEKILEKQKQLYKHISAPGHMIGENKNEMMVIRPEDTLKKDYLTKKKFKTGPY